MLGCLIFNFTAISSMGQQDLYKILGLTRVATERDIRKSYYSLALQYHPDKNKDEGAENVFKEIGKAYEVLSNAFLRREYDYLHPDVRSSSAYRRDEFFDEDDDKENR